MEWIKGDGKGGTKGGKSRGMGNTGGSNEQMLRAYTKQINELGKKARWSKAVEVFYYMKQQGVVPNVITYSALISAC